MLQFFGDLYQIDHGVADTDEATVTHMRKVLPKLLSAEMVAKIARAVRMLIKVWHTTSFLDLEKRLSVSDCCYYIDQIIAEYNAVRVPVMAPTVATTSASVGPGFRGGFRDHRTRTRKHRKTRKQ